VQDEPEPNQPELISILPHHDESFLKDCPSTLSSLDAGGPKIGRVQEEKKVDNRSRAIDSWKKPAPEAPKQKMQDLKQVKPVDVFQYEIDKPVSVKRGQSALVPFLSAEFLGLPCALYNESLNNDHPMSVILFRNTFSITLDSGPITIFDEDKCIGEAMVDSIPDGEHKFVAFGIERHISVKHEDKDEQQPIHESEVLNGQLTLTRYRRFIRIYKFNHTGSINLDNLYLEHRFRKGKEFTLVETPSPVSKTENYYRFYMQAKAGEITTYTVQEHRLEHEYHSIRGIQSGTANNWMAKGFIDRKVFDTILNEIIPLQERIDKDQKEINKDYTEMSAALARQSSAYSQVNSLTSSSYNRTVDSHIMSQVKVMIEQEDPIRKFRARLNERNLAQKQAQNELTNKINGIYYKGQIDISSQKKLEGKREK